MGEEGDDAFSDEAEKACEGGVCDEDGEGGLHDERPRVLALGGEFGGKGEEGEDESGGKEACDVGESRHHVVGCGIDLRETLTEDGRFDK